MTLVEAPGGWIRLERGAAPAVVGAPPDVAPVRERRSAAAAELLATDAAYDPWPRVAGADRALARAAAELQAARDRVPLATLWGRALPGESARRVRWLEAMGVRRCLFAGDETGTSVLAAKTGIEPVITGVPPLTRSWLADESHPGAPGPALDDEPPFDAAVVELAPGPLRYAALHEALGRVRPGGVVLVSGATVDAAEATALSAALPGLEPTGLWEHASLPGGGVLTGSSPVLRVARPPDVPSLAALAPRAGRGAGCRWTLGLDAIDAPDDLVARLGEVVTALAPAARILDPAGSTGAFRACGPDGATLTVEREREGLRLAARRWRGLVWALAAAAALAAAGGGPETRGAILAPEPPP